MNSELIYTIGVGNTRSYISVSVMQVILYILSVDMTDPAKGIFIATLLSGLVLTIAILSIQYYNSEMAVNSNNLRYVRNIEDKKRVFRKIMFTSYGVSIVLLTLLYFVKIVVAPHFLVILPVSVVILLVSTALHDFSLNLRYQQLSKESWVFDYRRLPVIRTKSKLHNISVNMFNNKNQFIANEFIEPADVDELFRQIPPGTIMKGDSVKKPSFKSIDFKSYYEYTNSSAFKIVYLKKDTTEEIKLYNLYLDLLSKYSGLYTIEDDFLKCCKMTMNLNAKKIEKYIDDNDYMKQYIASKDLEIAYIAIKLKSDLEVKSVDDFIKAVAKPVTDYAIRKKNNAIYILEPSDGDKEKEIDVSYLDRHMSFSIEDYQCQHDKEAGQQVQHFTSLKESIESSHGLIRSDGGHKEENDKKRTLYRINIKGELVYLFKEDFKSVGEIDEMIVTSFINRDIGALLKRVGYEE